MDLFTIGFAICLLSGLGCFWLFSNVSIGSKRNKRS